jgi:putative transposase
MPQSYSGLYYHIIFRTKDRHTRIPDQIFSRLGEYIGGTISGEGGKLLAYGGMPDHLHLLVSLGREHVIADVVKKIKASSSKWIHETFPELHSFSWQAGYGAFTVSPSIIMNTKKYIASQREHHSQRTYREELIVFLKEYGVEYDEKWLPDEDAA